MTTPHRTQATPENPGNCDSQFRIRAVVSDFDEYVDLFRQLSREAREGLLTHLDCRYGWSEAESLDVFLPDSTDIDRAIHIFFHGGYWRAFDKADYSYIARPLVESGAVVVVPNYGLMPAVTMAELITHCRNAIIWVYRNACSLGASSERISISGHSAGGHISSLLSLTDWKAYGLPADVIKSTLAVSGIYDLEPVCRSFLHRETGLTSSDVVDFSPVTCAARGALPSGRVLLSYGSRETNEFRRQAVAYADVLQRHGANVRLLLISERHHMNIVLDLGDPNTELCRYQLQAAVTSGRRGYD